jgi:hypothetical protein
VTLKLMEDHLQIRQEKIWQIREDLGKKKVCAKLVSYSLKDKLKEHSVTSCADFIQTCQTHLHFLICIITGNKCWFFSLQTWNKISPHGVENRIVPKAQEFLLAKLQDQNNVDYFLWSLGCDPQRICVWRKQWTYRC